MEKLQEILDRNSKSDSPLVGVLQDVNEEFGYLPEEVLEEISKKLEVPLSLLFSLATFYSSFRLDPIGDHHVCVCVGTACHVRGASRIIESFERELRIEASQTTPDKKYTLDTVNCLGACALGPLVLIDGEYHGKMEQKGVRKLLDKYDAVDADKEKSGEQESGK